MTSFWKMGAGILALFFRPSIDEIANQQVPAFGISTFCICICNLHC